MRIELGLFHITRNSSALQGSTLLKGLLLAAMELVRRTPFEVIVVSHPKHRIGSRHLMMARRRAALLLRPVSRRRAVIGIAHLENERVKNQNLNKGGVGEGRIGYHRI